MGVVAMDVVGPQEAIVARDVARGLLNLQCHCKEMLVKI